MGRLARKLGGSHGKHQIESCHNLSRGITHASTSAVEDYAKAIYALAAPRRRRVDQRAGRAPRRDAGVGVGDGQAARRPRARHATCPTAGVALTGAGRAGRARGPAPPPAARALPRRVARRAVGPRARRGRGARARALRGARGADRRQARPPDARPARRPDPRRGRLHIDEGETVAAGRPRARRARRRSCASPTPTPRCCATCAERGIAPGDRFEVVDKQPFDGPLFVRFGDGTHALGGALARAMRVEVAA